MNETKKTALVIGMVVLFLLVIPVAMMFKTGEGKDLVAKVEALINSKEAQIIYIGSKNCSYCTMFTPIIKEASENNDFEYTYFDIAPLTQSQYNRLADLLGKSEDGIGTPHTVIAKDGKIVAELAGYVEEAKLLEFLVTNKILEAKDVVVEETPLKMINYTEYESILNGTESKIVVFAQTTCSYCIQTKPVLEEIAEEYKIEINYFNIDKISTDEYKKLVTTLPLFESEWGTPTTVILANKTSKGMVSGAASKDAYVKLFKENGIIK